MGAIASVDDLVSRMSGGSSGTPENVFWHKSWRVAGAALATFLAGKPGSAWLMEGQPGDAPSPTSLIYPTNVTAGGMKQTDPGGGRQKWLTAASFMSEGAGGTILVYDRLAQQGGLSSSSTSNQSVSSTITRYTSGLGNWLWMEITTQASSPTTTTFHFDYTDENSNSATTEEHQVGAINFNSPSEVFIPGLATSGGTGGRGVKNMTNFKLAGSSGTGGDFCAVIAHPLFLAPCSAFGIASLTNWLQGSMPVEILSDACLGMLFLNNATASGYLMGSLHMVEA